MSTKGKILAHDAQAPVLPWPPCVGAKLTSGLSPHARGNPTRRLSTRRRAGSIPAHTGEPSRPVVDRGRNRVYPRTHGGTAAARGQIRQAAGLSPHTRGNPEIGVLVEVDARSIPAHTGEPQAERRRQGAGGVYPRTHGGTVVVPAKAQLEAGLSPHTRGNPSWKRSIRPIAGSIPAHTGEPRFQCRILQGSRVYPRTHGGTDLGDGQIDDVPGLSPHTRGNLARLERVVITQGSIPAHTGERRSTRMLR